MEEEWTIQEDVERRHSIQLRAYSLWEQRGRPLGTPEADWFVAEHELHTQDQDVSYEPPTIKAAKVVGSVLGSVAGLVGSVTHSFTSE